MIRASSNCTSETFSGILYYSTEIQLCSVALCVSVLSSECPERIYPLEREREKER